MIPAKSLTYPVGFGQARACACAGRSSPETKTAARRSLVRAIVRELEIKAEVLTFHRLDDGLEIVTLLSHHAHLVLLDLGLHADAAPLDELHDLLGLFGRNSLPNRDLLPHRSFGGGLDRFVLERLERHPALHELGGEDVDHGLESRLVVRGQRERLLLELDVADRALEVEPLADLLQGLLHRVRYLHQIHVGDDVERIVACCHPRSLAARREGERQKGEGSGAPCARFPPVSLATLCVLPLKLVSSSVAEN